MDKAPVVLVDAQPFVLVVGREQVVAVVTAAGSQGPPGRQGAPGPAGGSAVQRIAGEQLSALRVVYEWAGVVRYLDLQDAEHIDQVAGVTLTAVEMGELVNLQLAGPLDDAAWSWQPGPVWLGQAGTLTQTPPLDGHLLFIGNAVSPTRIIINIDQPIALAEE
ncbi:hypothetical protein [Phytopseudomonas punonensis]|uniref:hypothetical protein n=1 Tax=Phytopseudomonas punonensis TaxID=1220495 RepID=UPI001ABF96D0|nr:hypothetical protein [Pseudomonas punonensis]